MAGSLNKVLIIGNLGADPEMRYAPSGTAVTNFRVASTRRWTSPDGPKEETEWVSVVTWDKLAETCGQYLTKGRSVYVEGRLRTRSYDKDGQKHYRTEVVADTVQFLDSKPARSGEGGGDSDDEFAGGSQPSRSQRRPAGTRPPPSDQELDGDTDVDDIPF